MGILKKFLISLLVGMLVTGAFVVAGVMGLFDTFETTFYNSRVLELEDEQLSQVEEVFSDYESDILAHVQDMLADESFSRSFRLNQSNQDIQTRQQFITTFQKDFPSFQSLRIIDKDLLRIEYSSRLSDIQSRQQSGIVYFPVERIDFPIDVSKLVETYDSSPDRSMIRAISDDFQLFTYLFPMYDEFDIFAGYALVDVNTTSFRTLLIQKQLLSYASEVQLISPNGILINSPANPEQLLAELHSSWDSIAAGESLVFELEGSGESLLREYTSDQAVVLTLIPLSELTLSNGMIVFLSLILFFTAFLLLFLLLNIRQDSEVVIRDRVKRFQLDLLKQAVDQQGNVDVVQWQGELRRRKDDLKKQITAGIHRKDQKMYDELIDTSWDDILDLLGSRRSVNQIGTAQVNFDAAYLNQLVENIAAKLEKSGFDPNRLTAPREVAEAEELDESEELEEVTEAEELDEADELEEVAAAEELDEADELEEVAAAEELGEADELEEVTEAEELGEADELEEVAEAEELDEADELEEVAEAEELDEADELEEVAEAEELDESEESVAAVYIADSDDAEFDKILHTPTSELQDLALEGESTEQSEPNDEHEPEESKHEDDSIEELSSDYGGVPIGEELVSDPAHESDSFAISDENIQTIMDFEVESAIADVHLDLPDIAEFDLDMAPGEAVQAANKVMDDVVNPPKDLLTLGTNRVSGVMSLSGGYHLFGSHKMSGIGLLEKAPEPLAIEEIDSTEDVQALELLEEDGDDTAQELESFDEAEYYSELSEAEDLEAEIDELPPATVRGRMSEEGQLVRLPFQTLLKQVRERFTQEDAVILERDGLHSISDETYYRAGRQQPMRNDSSEFAELVDEVTTPSQDGSAADQSLGIHDIFQGEDVDFDDILGEGGSNAPEDETSSQETRKHYYDDNSGRDKLLLTEDGLHYQRYEASFPERKSRKLKALMKLSRESNAVCLILISAAEDGFRAVQSIGFPMEHMNDFTADDLSLFRSVTDDDATYIVPANLLANRLPVLAPVSERVSGVLLLPVLYADAKGVMAFGLLDVPDDMTEFCKRVCSIEMSDGQIIG